MQGDTERAVFREVQRFGRMWIWLLILAVALGAGWAFVQQIVLGEPFGDKPAPDWMLWILFAFFGIGLPLLFHILRLVVEVRDDSLYIRFHPFGARTIPFSEIAKFEARTYRPILEYGGWGIRWSRAGRAYNVSGNRGVQLELEGGKRLLIGSQRAEELEQAIAERRKRAS
ncbi:MAG: DUF6141 family protein [Planctomycetota bacterium]|jgi:hypothetical protein